MSAYQPSKRHPLALTLIVAGHGAVLTALMLSKMEVPAVDPIKRIIAENIPAPKPPEPLPRPEPQPKAEPSQTASVIDRSPLPIPSNNSLPPAPPTPAPPTIPIPDVPIGPRTILPPPLPAPTPVPPAATPDPVRLEAQRDPRADFQPPYPDSLRAQGEEGRAVVRVRVGTDGRVKAAEEVSATHPAFMSATVRHARRSWRFRPATVDGKPVESWKQVTVTFTLND